jgi:hypothetical protein
MALISNDMENRGAESGAVGEKSALSTFLATLTEEQRIAFHRAFEN